MLQSNLKEKVNHSILKDYFSTRTDLSIFTEIAVLLDRSKENRQVFLRRHGVVVITTAQLHSTKPELRFCAGLNPSGGVSEICDGEDL